MAQAVTATVRAVKSGRRFVSRRAAIVLVRIMLLLRYWSRNYPVLSLPRLKQQ